MTRCSVLGHSLCKDFGGFGWLALREQNVDKCQRAVGWKAPGEARVLERARRLVNIRLKWALVNFCEYLSTLNGTIFHEYFFQPSRDPGLDAHGVVAREDTSGVECFGKALFLNFRNLHRKRRENSRRLKRSPCRSPRRR